MYLFTVLCLQNISSSCSGSHWDIHFFAQWWRYLYLLYANSWDI